MSIATETQKIVRNSFDTNHETVDGILRPSLDAGDTKIFVGHLGAFVRLDGKDLKAANRNAQGQVKFYHLLLQEFKSLPDEVRSKLVLETKDSLEGSVISVGKYRGSDPTYARHSIELVLRPIHGEKFQTDIHRVEYDGNRRKEFGLPVIGAIEHARGQQQADVARMFAYMNLGFGEHYQPRA